MARRLWENLGTLLLALIVAAMVWVVALDEENPLEENPFSQPIPIQLTNLPANMILLNPAVAGSTEFTLKAPRLVWQALCDHLVFRPSHAPGRAPRRRCRRRQRGHPTRVHPR